MTPYEYFEQTYTGVDWNRIVAARPRCACRSLAELAAEALVAAQTREDIGGLGLPEPVFERWVAPILAGRAPTMAVQEPAAAPVAPQDRIGYFNWEENWENVDDFQRAVGTVLAPFADGPHAKILPIPYPTLKAPGVWGHLRSRTQQVTNRLRSWTKRKRDEDEDDDDDRPSFYDAWAEPIAAWRAAARETCPCVSLFRLEGHEEVGHGRKLFCIIPKVSEYWTSERNWPTKDAIVNEVSVVPDESEIDGILRYGLTRVAQELLGGFVDDAAALRPAFFLCRESTRW